MTAIRQPTPHMTVEAFLAWSGGGHQGKLELVDGLVRAMAPASATRAIIQGNIVAGVHSHLRARRSGCRVAPGAPVRPAMGQGINARAPDVAVTCAPPSVSKTFDDPVLIVEVLSPGNLEDTWESIRALAPLPTLREILLVQSESVGLEIYRKDQVGAWADEPERHAAGSVHLASIAMDLEIADVYAGTHLAEAGGG
ncbi:MAG: Uma2 family endonuclease [Proteobacteria bacterium]|nr:Uma2 family endonuclease [Pseudomonadota bacterium]